MLRNASLLSVWLLAAAACSSETPGKIVSVVWQLERASEPSFELPNGFHVQLEEARVGVSALYAFAPLESDVKAQAWRWLSGVSVAHAHGGIDPESGRRVRAELLEPVLIDLLASDAEPLPPVAAEAGAIDALKIELAQSGAAGELHGGSAFLRGEAERDGVRFGFQASVVLGAPPKARSIDLTGLRGQLDDGSVLHVRVNPAAWLSHAELDRLAAPASDEPVEIGADTQVGRALVIGVRSPEAFELEVTAGDKGKS